MSVVEAVSGATNQPAIARYSVRMLSRMIKVPTSSINGLSSSLNDVRDFMNNFRVNISGGIFNIFGVFFSETAFKYYNDPVITQAMEKGEQPPGVSAEHQRVRSCAIVLPPDKPYKDAAKEALLVQNGREHVTV